VFVFPGAADNDIDCGRIAVEGAAAGVAIAQEMITGDETNKTMSAEIPVISKPEIEIEGGDLGGGPIGSWGVAGGEVHKVDTRAARDPDLPSGMVDEIARVIETNVAAVIVSPGHQRVVPKKDIGIGAVAKTQSDIDIKFIVDGAGAETIVERGMNAQQGQVTGRRPDAGAGCQYKAQFMGAKIPAGKERIVVVRSGLARKIERKIFIRIADLAGIYPAEKALHTIEVPGAEQVIGPAGSSEKELFIDVGDVMTSPGMIVGWTILLDLREQVGVDAELVLH